MIDPRIKTAKGFFATFVKLVNSFDPAVADMYADDAKIRNTRTRANADVLDLDVPGRQYKRLIGHLMPVAKRVGDTDTFTNQTFTLEGTGVRIKATRHSDRKDYDSPFEILIAPSENGVWLIREENSQSREVGGRPVRPVAGQDALFDALEDGADLARVQEAARRVRDLNIFNEDGDTPLHCAVGYCPLDVVAWFVEQGLPINQQNTDGWTPLHVACQEGREDVVSFLLAHGASVRKRLKWGYTPLHVASEKGHLGVVRVLIRHGADVNTKSKKGRPPLGYAAHAGHLKVAAYLIESGTDLNLRDKAGYTPFFCVAGSGSVSLCERALRHGANIHAVTRRDETPLHVAAEAGASNVVKWLLAHGLPIDTCTKNGITPLLSAVNNGHARCALMLIRMEADVGGCLHSAASAGLTSVVRELLAHGVPVDLETDGPETPLLLAANDDRTETAEHLIRAGANVNAVTDDGWTPLHAFARNNNVRMVQLLLSKGARVDVKWQVNGKTPLDLAKQFSSPKMVALLSAHAKSKGFS